MLEAVKKILKKSKRAMCFEEICEKVKANTTEEKNKVREFLKSGVANYDIYCTPKNKYVLMSKTSFKKGYFHGSKYGNGKISIDGKEFWINEDKTNGAIEGDYVLFDPIYRKKTNHHNGEVITIIQRDLDNIVGEVVFVNNKAYLRPDSENQRTIAIEIVNREGLVEGHKVVVKLGNSEVNNYYYSNVVKVIGHRNDPDIDVKMIAYKNGIVDEFSPDVLKELSSIPTEVSSLDKIGRLDLTNQEIFTIDGDDTKDIDDAISLQKLNNGNYMLGVHIADVTYYVKAGSNLYKEAYQRGNSVYLSDYVIPMLPHVLSNGICSLNPNVERLTLSCIMEIDKDGNIVNHDLRESVIKSNKQMTYKKVNQVLEDNLFIEDYDKYKETLINMKELSDIIRKKRRNRGCSEINRPELKIMLDSNGNAFQVTKKEQHTAEKIIEDFMIMANECVAKHMTKLELPFIYRTHGDPDIDGIREYLRTLSLLGYEMHLDLKDTNPLTIQKIADFIQDKEESVMLKNQLLRSFDKAIYSPYNEGHSGLASPCYTHFTSPIRRFSDTTVHGLIRDFVFQKRTEKANIVKWEKQLPNIAYHISDTEKTAAKCEREVLAMKSAEYMMNHIGQIYKGMITDINEKGLCVQLDNLIEGMVRISDFDGVMVYDEDKKNYLNKENGLQYRLGDQLELKVKSASKTKSQINFEIMKKINETIMVTKEQPKVFMKSLAKEQPISHKYKKIPVYRNQRY